MSRKQGPRTIHLIRLSDERNHFVYRAFDVAERLLYVGCTKRPKERWKTHRMQSAWAKHAVRFRVAGPYTYQVARQLEREALATEQPLYGLTPERRAEAARQNACDRRLWQACYVEAGGDSRRAWALYMQKAVPA